MRFDLTKPCGNCPYRTDRPFYLCPERTAEILDAITDGQQTFACHKTVDYDAEDDDEESAGDGRHTTKTQHCAGALILLEKLERPNQMMRIAERLGLYDRRKLKMDAPVFDTPAAMIDAMEKLEAGGRA